jgi:hypothetical protein
MPRGANAATASTVIDASTQERVIPTPKTEPAHARDVQRTGVQEGENRQELFLLRESDRNSRLLVRFVVVVAVILLGIAIVMPPPISLFDRFSGTARIAMEIGFVVLTLMELAAGLAISTHSSSTHSSSSVQD